MTDSGEATGQRPRVAMVSFTFGEGCFRLGSALADRADVLLVTSQREAEANGRYGDERMELWAEPMPRLRQVIAQLRYQRRAIRAIRRFGPDVVHIQQGFLWLNLLLFFLRRYPLVISVHDPRFHLGDEVSRKVPQRIYDLGFRRADLLIVHVPQMVEPIVEEVGIPSERVRVVPHVAIGDQEMAAGVTEDDGTILWFGRIWPYKGLDYLIRAQPRISERLPDATIIIAGEGEDFGRYRAQMADPDRFEVHNEYVSAELLAELIRRSSVVVLPYLEATQSGVVVTAYSYGKPIVASAVGGLCEQVDDGVTGILVPPADERALADALIEMLSDDDRRAAMGQAAHRKLTSEWSAPVVSDQTMAVYREAIELRGR